MVIIAVAMKHSNGSRTAPTYIAALPFPQMAKDVTELLNWAAEPEMDQRKKMGLKVLAISSVLFALSVWVKRYKWVTIKTRKIAYDPPKMGGRH